jgi:DNA repair exonuclease SbcCD ATPase subunit
MVKCLIQIDGANKTGSCKYFAYKSTTATLTGETDWEALPGIDGNCNPYLAFVNTTFGPIELFMRTAFITQRPTKNLPDLADATAGEKKKLFVELAGIDYLQQFSDVANERAKEQDNQAYESEIKAQMLETEVAKKIVVKENLTTAETSLKERNAELIGIIASGKAARAEADTAREADSKERERERMETEARATVDGTVREIMALEEDRQRNEKAAKEKGINEDYIEAYETYQKVIDAETAKKNAVLEANLKKQEAYTKAKAAHDLKMRNLETERNNLVGEKEHVLHLTEKAKDTISLYERDAAEIKDTCPTCGQKMPPEKIAELQEKRKKFVARIEEKKTEIADYDKRVVEIDKALPDITQQIAGLDFDAPMPPTLEEFDPAKLRDAQMKQRPIDIAKARANLDLAKSAAVRIESLEKQITDKTSYQKEKEAVLAELIAQRNPRAHDDLVHAQAQHEAMQDAYTACKANIAALETTIENKRKHLCEIEAQEYQLLNVKAVIRKAKEELVEWELITKAFGRDGIQALELDALAPGISETANRILESAYGDRFRIDIETTRMGGQGKKTKQIEDFKIMVTDSEDGEPVALENKSGGEAVWIKRAIYDAFAVIRKRNTDFAFLTCFQDETDGALDATAKTAYCQMLQAAHDEAKLCHTIIITHSNEVKAMVEQKIDMEGL